MMGRLLVIFAIGTSLYGCAEAGYGKSDESWNTWIGTTKDDRVKDQGIPTRCHTFKSGGEACEWPVTWAPNSVGTITMTFAQRRRLPMVIQRRLYGEAQRAKMPMTSPAGSTNRTK